MVPVWSSEIWRSAGRIGATGQVVEWRMLGQSRQRSYELRCSDPVPVRWTDAWVEVQLAMQHRPSSTFTLSKRLPVPVRRRLRPSWRLQGGSGVIRA